MQCKEIIEVIEENYPKEAALNFDNVGLQAGRSTKKVSKILLALDATTPVIELAEKQNVDMLITHHPLIFSPLKSITDQDFVGKRILRLIQDDIAYYAMHTNYDVLGMAELSEEILQLKETEVLDVTGEFFGISQGIGRVGLLESTMSLRSFCDYVKEKLVLSNIKVFGNLDKEIKKVTISPGSGKSEIEVALKHNVDVLVTGDIGHHEGLDAMEQGLAIIDAGHYGTEYIFVDDMKKYLSQRCPGVEIITEPVSHPFQVI